MKLVLTEVGYVLIIIGHFESTWNLLNIAVDLKNFCDSMKRGIIYNDQLSSFIPNPNRFKSYRVNRNKEPLCTY